MVSWFFPFGSEYRGSDAVPPSFLHIQDMSLTRNPALRGGRGFFAVPTPRGKMSMRHKNSEARDTRRARPLPRRPVLPRQTYACLGARVGAERTPR